MKKMLHISISFILSIAIISCGGDDIVTPESKPKPEVTSIQPDSGPPGASVTISGRGFQPHGSMSVSFDGTSATIISATKDQIQTEVPEGATTGAVSVSVGGETVSGPSFTVEAKAPGITSVEPDSGTIGTEVTIKGMNFSSNSSEVTIAFDGVDAPVKSASKSELITGIPKGATDGPVKVTVKQKSTTGPDFDVITEGSLKIITTSSGPQEDPEGFEVTLDGGQSKSVGISDTLYYHGLQKGIYETELKEVASKCEVSGSNPRSISITPGDTASTHFDVFCKQPKLVNKVVFNSDRDGDDEIYMMDPDGSNIKKITDNNTFDGRPIISNDGSKIAFQSRRNSNPTDLYIMNVDGSNVRKITNTSGATYGFSWSPDDSKIAFMDTKSGGFELYTINVDGTGMSRLTNNSADDEYPSWSPDGSSITFTSDRSGNNHIYKMDSDGNNVKQLTSGYTLNSNARWSPDGSRLAFNSNRNTGFKIFTMDPDGSDIKQVTTHSSSFDLQPSWSPDGTELIFETDRDGKDEIYKIDVNGTGNAINLTQNPAIDRDPFWSPVK